MAVEFILDSLDQVEESLRPAYEEREGKFHLNADQYAELKAAGLKRKNAELLDGQKKLKEQFGKLERFKDVSEDDWDGYRQYVEAKQSGDPGVGGNGKASAADLEKAVEAEKKRFDRQIRDLQAQKEALSQEMSTKVQSLEAQLRDYTIWIPVRDLGTKFEVLPDRAEAFYTLLKTQNRFDLDENGKLIFKDQNGYPTTMTPEKAFEVELKRDYQWAFKGSGVSGSGAQQSTNNSLRQELSKLSATERLKAARQAGVKE